MNETNGGLKHVGLGPRSATKPSRSDLFGLKCTCEFFDTTCAKKSGGDQPRRGPAAFHGFPEYHCRFGSLSIAFMIGRGHWIWFSFDFHLGGTQNHFALIFFSAVLSCVCVGGGMDWGKKNGKEKWGDGAGDRGFRGLGVHVSKANNSVQLFSLNFFPTHH